jgi:hypothetical protein
MALEEYRVPTDEEWTEFLGHFELRKVATGTCGRAFGTPCIHEHSCLRCSMHWPSPAQRPRIAEIHDNLIARIAEAEREGWHGEAEGLKISLAGPATSSPRSTGAPTQPSPSASACPPSPPERCTPAHRSEPATDPITRSFQVQRMRNIAISLLRLSGATSIAAALRHHAARTERPIALLLTS